MKQSPGTDSRLLETLRAKLSGSGDTCIPSRDDLADLLAAHEKLIRRFDRVVKISDGYQYQLQETTKALQDALTNVKMLSGRTIPDRKLGSGHLPWIMPRMCSKLYAPA